LAHFFALARLHQSQPGICLDHLAIRVVFTLHHGLDARPGWSARDDVVGREGQRCGAYYCEALPTLRISQLFGNSLEHPRLCWTSNFETIPRRVRRDFALVQQQTASDSFQQLRALIFFTSSLLAHCGKEYLRMLSKGQSQLSGLEGSPPNLPQIKDK
jgi:hypothetical protein